jgi:hypothetical protein
MRLKSNLFTISSGHHVPKRVIDPADSAELTKRYLTLRDGKAAENPISRLACVLAGKSGLLRTMA